MKRRTTATPEPRAPHGPDTTSPCSAIGDVRWRQRVRVRGRVRAVRVQPWAGGVATLECTLVDETGGLTVSFMGRRQIAGVHVGCHMEVEGMAIEHRGMLAIMNPGYTLRPD